MDLMLSERGWQRAEADSSELGRHSLRIENSLILAAKDPRNGLLPTLCIEPRQGHETDLHLIIAKRSAAKSKKLVTVALEERGVLQPDPQQDSGPAPVSGRWLDRRSRCASGTPARREQKAVVSAHLARPLVYVAK